MHTYNHFVDDMSSVEALALSDEAYKARAESHFVTGVDPQAVEAYNEVASRTVPGYTPPTEEQKTARRDLQDLAKRNFGPAVRKMAEGTLNVPEFSSLKREFQCVFKGMGNTPKDIEKKTEMSRILREGSAEERHDLFLEVLNRMASFDIEAYRNMSEKQQLQHLDELLPLFQMGMEGEGLLSEFRNMNCGVTKEEGDLFTTMTGHLNIECMDLSKRLEQYVNPYYPEIDTDHIPTEYAVIDALDDALGEKLDEMEIGKPEELSSLEVISTVHINNNKGSRQENIAGEYFREAGISQNAKEIFLCDANGVNINAGQNLQAKWQEEGKTIYYKAPDQEGQMKVLAFKDFLGNGNLVQVPKEVPEPNGFLRLVDALIRFFGGDGLESVRKYDEYKEEMERLAQEARQNGATVNTKYKNAASAVKEKVAQRNLEKEAVREAAEAETAELARQQQKSRSIEELNKTLSELQAEAKKQPEAGRSRDRELADDLNNVAQGEMSRLVIGALAELKGTGERGEVAEPLAEIALAAVTDRMISDYESRPGEKTRHPLTTLLEDDNSYAAMLNTIRTSKEFSAYVGLSGSELVRQLRNPEEKERFTSAMYSVVNNALNSPTINAVKEAVKVEKPSVERESKEADAGSHWRNPISEAPSVFGSKENQEKAIDYICKRLAAEQTGKSSRLSRADKEWINSHKELMAAVADEAKERYALNVYNELHTRASETITNRKARLDKAVEIARIMAGGKVPTTEEQRKFFADRPGTMRDGFEIVKREFLAENPEPLTVQQSETLEMLERIGKSKANQALANAEAISSAEDRLSKLPDEIRTQAETIAAFFTKTGTIENKNLQWANENREAVYDAVLCARHEYNLVNYGKPYTMEQENLQVSMLKFMDSPKKFLADAMKKAAAEKKEADLEPMKKAKEAPVKSV